MNIIKIIFTINLFILSLFSIELITPIPQKLDYYKPKALLGKKLFFDKRLSADNTISCASCHNIASGGDDDSKVSTGINNLKGLRNSPTVFNAVFNTSQFWDARANNLIEQAQFPIHSPVEMNSNFKQILSKLKKDKEYVKEFNTIFNENITEKNIIEAIVEFEKTLITPNSRFDKYLKGDKNALSQDEISGYETFKNYGCVSCHNGINLGGNIVQKIGIMEKYDSKDLGRHEITNKEYDKYYFKVPSLRNVALTAPYFHDGSVKTLAEAVNLMAYYQIGFPLTEKESKNIIKFLYSLTGEFSEIKK